MTHDADMAESLLREHGSKLILFARQHVNRHADAEDVVQEAFVRYWRQRDHVRDPVAYLFRCVRTAAIDWHQRRRREQNAPSSHADRDHFEPADGRAITVDRQRVLTAALELLAPEQREVVVMRIWGNLTFDQIGESLNLPKSTAFSRYEAAMRLLRENLDAVPV